MSEIKIGTKVRVIGGDDFHYLKHGSVGIVQSKSGGVYSVLGEDERDGSMIRQKLIPSEFEVVEENCDGEFPITHGAPRNHYELIDELATLVGVAGDESAEARWNDEIFKRRVLRRAIEMIMKSKDCCEGGPQWGHSWNCPSLP